MNEVGQEAIEAAAKTFQFGDRIFEGDRLLAKDAVEAAYPAIRSQVLAEVGAALIERGPIGEDVIAEDVLSEAQALAAHQREVHGAEDAWLMLDVVLLGAVRLALATLTEENNPPSVPKEEEERSAAQCSSCKRDFEAEGYDTVPIDWGCEVVDNRCVLTCPTCESLPDEGGSANRLRLPPEQAAEECQGCGHTRKWHGQERGAVLGTGACEDCDDCLAFQFPAAWQPRWFARRTPNAKPFPVADHRRWAGHETQLYLPAEGGSEAEGETITVAQAFNFGFFVGSQSGPGSDEDTITLTLRRASIEALLRGHGHDTAHTCAKAELNRAFLAATPETEHPDEREG